MRRPFRNGCRCPLAGPLKPHGASWRWRWRTRWEQGRIPAWRRWRWESCPTVSQCNSPDLGYLHGAGRGWWCFPQQFVNRSWSLSITASPLYFCRDDINKVPSDLPTISNTVAGDLVVDLSSHWQRIFCATTDFLTRIYWQPMCGAYICGVIQYWSYPVFC